MQDTLVQLLILVSLGAAGCASGEIPLSPRDPARPGLATAPLPASLDVLAPNFDAERAAPHAPAEGDNLHAGHGKGGAPTEARVAMTYTCPHHPAVVSEKPGVCPICGMELIPKPASSPEVAAPVDGAAPAPSAPQHHEHGQH